MPCVEPLRSVVGGVGGNAGLLRAAFARPAEEVPDEQAAGAGPARVRGDPHALQHGYPLGMDRARPAQLPDQVPDDAVTITGQSEQAGPVGQQAGVVRGALKGRPVDVHQRIVLASVLAEEPGN